MPKQMEINVGTIEAFNKDCEGCKNHKSEIMISAEQSKKRIGDSTSNIYLFLSQKQATRLIRSLQVAINHNNSFTTMPME